VVSVGAAALLWPVIAWADKTVQASPPNRFNTPEFTIDQGEKVTFRNGDTVAHDLTASDATGGKPLFATPIVEPGKSALVEGTEYLTEGHYAYVCTLHNGMKGTLHVTAAGTPVPRPGGGGAVEEPRPTDKVKPTIDVALVSRTANMARVRGALVVRVTLSEVSHLELRAIARPKAGGPLVTVAKSLRHKVDGTRRVRLKLTPAGEKALRRDRSLAVIVKGVAIDLAGNMARAAHGRTLTP
jgi:plastocyanin